MLYLIVDYLSINKEQTVKAIALNSRSDFVAWFSALRLAKCGYDSLTIAYQNKSSSAANIVTSSSAAAAPTRPGNASKSFKTKATAIMDIHKVKGNKAMNHSLFSKYCTERRTLVSLDSSAVVS